MTQPRVAVATPSARPSQCWSRQALTRRAPFALVFLLAIFLLTLNIATPWHSSHEDNGLVFESAAINHIRFGLGFTKGQDYFDLSVTQPAISPASIHPQGVRDAQEFQYFLTGPTHPELYGHHPAGVRRIGYAVVGVSYLSFALAALRLMLQNAAPKGSNATTQDWTARLMSAPGGVSLVVLLGLIMLGVAIGLFYEAWKLRFERYFPLGQMNEVERKLTRYTGRFGIGSLGAIFLVMSIFLIEAAIHHDPHKAQGLAGALATLAAQPFGPLLLGLIALGLVAYGVFGWVEARYRRIHA